MLNKYKIIKQLQNNGQTRTLKVKSYNQQLFKITIAQLNTTAQSQNIRLPAIEKYFLKCRKYLNLNHPNIERITDYFIETKGQRIQLGIVGQLDGEDLYDYIGGNGNHDKNKLKQVLIDIVSGLEYLHSHQILFDSLNLKNIQKAKTEENYKLKFTFIRQINNFNKVKDYDRYTSPEKYWEESYNHSADIWALGILFIELISGQPLENFEQNQPYFPCNIVQFPSKQLFQKMPNCNVRSLIRDMLKKNPSERPHVSNVKKILEGLRLDLTDQEDQEQIQQTKGECFPTIIQMFPLLQRKKSNIKHLICTQLALLQKSIQIPIKNYKISISFCKELDILQIMVHSILNAKIFLSLQITSQTIPSSLKLYFQTASILFKELSQISSKKLALTCHGELIIEFDIKYKRQLLFSKKQKDNRIISQTRAGSKIYSSHLKQQQNNYHHVDNISKYTKKFANPRHKQIEYQQNQQKLIPSRNNNHAKSIYNDLSQMNEQTILSIQETAKYMRLASEKFQAGSFQQAIQHFLKLIQLQKKRFPHYYQVRILPFYFSIGFSFYQLQKYKEGQFYYEKLYFVNQKYKEGSPLSINQDNQEFQERRIKTIMFGYVCATLSQTNSQEVWEERIEKFTPQNKRINIKIRSLLQLTLKYSFVDLQKSNSYFYRLISLVDTNAPITDETLISYYSHIAFLLHSRIQNSLSEVLNLYTNIFAVLKCNQQQRIQFQGSILYDLLKINQSGKSGSIQALQKWVKQTIPESYSMFFSE